MSVYSTSERTKQALIQAAGELLAERGVGRVSTRAIADRAGENLGSLHYHFGSKEGLLKEVLRFACQDHTGPSPRDLIAACRPHLDTPRGQALAVRKLIQHLRRFVLSPDRPRWCSRVLYHVAQHAGPLRSFLRKTLRDPHMDAIRGLVLRVRPEWTTHQVHLWAYLLIGGLVFHVDHGEMILDRMGLKAFPEEYLDRLEQRLIEDATRALGLVPEAASVRNHPASAPPRRRQATR